MMRYLFAFVLAFWASSAHAQLVHENSNAANLSPTAGVATYTYPVALTSGRLEVLVIDSDGRTVSSVAGSSTTYTSQVSRTWGLSSYSVSIWKAVAGGADTDVTITFSSQPGDSTRVCWLEFSGNASDQSGATSTSSAVSASTTHDSGSVTPPTANNVVVTGAARDGASGWTNDGAFTYVSYGSQVFRCGYLTQTSATAQESNDTSDVSRYSGNVIAAFAGASSGASCKGSLMLLGVGGC